MTPLNNQLQASFRHPDISLPDIATNSNLFMPQIIYKNHRILNKQNPTTISTRA